MRITLLITLILLLPKHLHHTNLLKISPTLHHRHSIHTPVNNNMIMPTQYDIYIRWRLCKIQVITISHVCECDDEITMLLMFEFV